MRTRLVLPFLLALTACGDYTAIADPAPRTPLPSDSSGVELFAGCAADAPAADVPPAARDSILAASASDGTMDGRMVQAAHGVVPAGWGGLYILPDGRYALLLVDPARLGDVVTARNAHPDILGRHLPPDSTVAVPARWSFEQLYLWKVHLMNDVVQEPELILAGIDVAHNRLLYGVASEAARTRLAVRLQRLGIPCRLVVIQLTSPPIPA
jgi:hypothetical protein